MGAGDGGRQRARVGGPTLPASSSAGELTRSPAGSTRDACSPISSPISAGRMKLPQQQQHQQEAPLQHQPLQLHQHQFLQQQQQQQPQSSPRPASPVMVFRQEAPAVQQLSAGRLSAGGAHSSVPEPPVPRCWTPSKLSNGSAGGAGPSTPRCMTPAEALEQEMRELCCAAPGSPTSGSMQRPHSCTPASSSMGPGGVRRPSSTGGSPHAAQHNNLVGAASSGRPHSTGAVRADSWSSSLGLTKGLRDMKERLTSLGSDTSSTAVEAFAKPLCGPACSDANSPVVVARRRGTAPARLQPSGATTGCRSAAQWEQECTQLLSAGDRLAVLPLPGPSNGVVRCYIKRTSNLLGMATLFELRLESTDELLAVAHKRVNSATSCFDISLASGSSSSAAGGSGSSTPSSGPSHHGGGAGSSSSAGSTLGSSALGSSSKDSPQLVGKLKGNLLGTEYLLRGRGGDYAAHKGFGVQLLAVNYKPTVNHIQAAPRTMSALLPLPGSLAWDGARPASSGGGDGGQFDSLTVCLDAARERQLPMAYERDLVMLHTMRPHFDAAKQVHYLDFKGRVTKVSGKNFQLVHWDHNANQLGTDLVLLFGKRGHGEFALDFSYPMNPLQAFALGLSSIDSKLCYAM